MAELSNFQANASNMEAKDHAKSHNERLENGLTARQMTAAELLAMGRKVNEAAEIAGVTRRQIWLWKQNPYFISAISQKRTELWQNSKHRLRSLVDRSVAVIEEAVEAGDLKAAIEVLKIVGLHGKVGSPGKVLSIDEVLEMQAAEFVDSLMTGLPKGTPSEELAFQMKVRPVLIQEQYQELKVNLELPEDEIADVDEEKAEK